NGESIGSKFLVQSDRLEGRKQWLFAAPQVGSLVVDKGAEAALLQHKSLLPVGVSEINGVFSRGEVVKIFNQEGKALALGLARYNSDALIRIKGKKSKEIESL
ncbi:glutamate 5-kinase, partial [Xanthomonas citri pv. citri]|nr:glutamate 5-kinase [Xanthomonas citri pv. citri]